MKVSVIIPAFNAEIFIEKAVRSVTSQTLQDFEIIIVDDGSSDRTAEIVRTLSTQDDRITLVQHKIRSGISVSRNDAIAKARGEWIAVLDADDEFLPERLERMVTAAETRGLDMVADQLALVDFDTSRPFGLAFRQAWLEEPGLLSAEAYLRKDWPGLANTYHFGFMKPIIRTEFLRRTGICFNPEAHLAEDLLMWVSLLLAGAKLGVIPQALYSYYVRPASVSRIGKVTTQLLQVNTLMVTCLKQLSARGKLADGIDYADFVELFRKRHKALWVQYLLLSLKGRAYSNLPRAILHVSPAIMAQVVKGFVASRLRRMTERLGLKGLVPPKDPDQILI